MADETATVATLTAEVRTLVVGNRQVTLSVYRQLDWIKPEAIEPFGRVRSGEKWTKKDYFGGRDDIPYVAVVGRVKDGYQAAGELARSRVSRDSYRAPHGPAGGFPEWDELPLIVLAGLR